MARILIVDDAAFMRMMLKDILTKGGFEIAGEAADGNEAVAPQMEEQQRRQLLKGWHRAVKCALAWAEDEV